MAGTVDPTTLLDAPLADLMAEAARLRDSAHGARITFSPKVFIPLTMLCRDRCGYCTFAKPPAHLEAPYLSLDEVLDIARRGAALGCHEALFTLGEAPEDRYPVAGRLARGARLLVDGRLPRRGVRGGARGDRAAPPRQCRRALAAGARTAAAGVAVAGNDDRDARGPPRGAGWPARGRARQDPRAPAGHARGRGTRRDPVHHRHPRRHRRDARRAARRARRDPRRARASRARAGGDRPELPAQAGHRDVAARRRAIATSSSGPSRPRASCSVRTCTSRHRRTSPTPTSSARSSPPASTTGAACRRSLPTT